MTHSLRIHAVRYAADGVLLFDLRHPEELELPGFEPGAHIDLNLPEERIRSYSLINDPAERHRDQIGVRRAPDGRGGSARMHDFARVGEGRGGQSLHQLAVHRRDLEVKVMNTLS